MEWFPRQLLQQSAGALRFEGGFEFAPLPGALGATEALVSRSGGGAIELVASGARVSLRFVTHAWSGGISLEVEGRESSHLLFSDDPGFKTIDLALPRRTGSLVTIRSSMLIDAQAQGRELWLAAVDFDGPQDWLPRSMPLSPTCQFTRATHGAFLSLREDADVGAAIGRNGTWQPDVVAALQACVRPGMTVVDAHAHLGHHSVVLGHLAGPTGRLICIEPDPVLHRLLGANLLLNGLAAAQTLAVAAGDAVAHGGAPAGLRLDDALPSGAPPLQRLDLLRLSTRGTELAALRGASGLIARFRPQLLIDVAPFWMEPRGELGPIARLLEGWGYRCTRVAAGDAAAAPPWQWNGHPAQSWSVLALPAQA